MCWGWTMEEYSASSTLIPFPTPLPLLRQPIPTDDPGSFLLAFPDPQSFNSSLTFCQSQITLQCESGSRVGCSISASNKCKPIWWKRQQSREDCEEQEMQRCFEQSRKKCVGFARDKCVTVFRDARVALTWRNVDSTSVRNLLCLATLMGTQTSTRGFQFLRSQLAISTYTPTHLLREFSEGH